jgi:nucleotide-binding universal stress UspA family protein
MTIMVATDGSSGACRAIDVAAELAKTLACDLLIVANHLLASATSHRTPPATCRKPGQTLRAAEAPSCVVS